MTHRYDEAIIAAMRRVADAAEGHDAIEKSLAQITRAAVDLIDGVDCATVLVISDGGFQSIAATSVTAMEIDQAQQRTGQGPCHDAADRDVIVRSSDLREDDRWPEFAQIARAAGVLSVTSFRLYTQGANSGALNLFGFQPESLTAESEALGAMLATQAALLILAADRQQQFESALASRDVIGQAKGILMERFDVDAMQAFELLTGLSQQLNTPVKIIAERLVRRGENTSTVDPGAP
ncbi:hypothetical protein K883_05163 [Mycobacterium sp. TKK-01-0059]|uniref:GAF and ANTAR domain-containing protein n=1 Tax=Mycobacterium sp. TKK-01-0059 TaxID=1324269 RepID=UPI0004D55E36|nr:GAF and ANTAR domain-containing protein [Mycobacterium sp. TKK-01-0059]KEF94978.1 hypothetical protein K883_05163 [Mycobacterium sp. TKK-01-0059]